MCSRTRTFSPALANSGVRKRKWIGGHLGGQDLVAGLAHLLGEDGAGLDVAGCLLAGGFAGRVTQSGGVDGTRHQATDEAGASFRSIRSVFRPSPAPASSMRGVPNTACTEERTPVRARRKKVSMSHI